MDTHYLDVDISYIYGIMIIPTLFAMFFYWWTLSPIDSKLDKLRTYAKGLKLKIQNEEEYTVFEAVADQLNLLNPHGSYKPDIIKHQIKRKETTSFMKIVRYQFRIWMKRDMWKGDLEELNAIADSYKRIIEVVHCDRKETTVIRPVGTGITRHMQIIYIGYGGEGRFYSLRPEADIKPSETRPTPKPLKDSNSVAKSNILIGNDAVQYVNLPRDDQDDEHVVTKNIVIGNNISQNILATFRTPKEVIDLLHEMESSGTEGSGHKLRLKIREKSSTLSDEEIREKHKRIIDLLEDKSSETRKELEEALKAFNVTYEKASLECILLHLKLDTFEKLRAFVMSFQAGELEKVMKVIVCKLCDNTSQSAYDVQLRLSINLSATERTKISNSSKYVKENHSKDTVLKPKCMAPGFSLVLRQRTDQRQDPLVSPAEFTQAVSEATCESLSKTLMLRDTSEMEFNFEKFCTLEAGKYTKKLSRDAVLQNTSNTMSESMRGCVGFIRVDSANVGTCFRVGSNYIMTAYHVIKAAIDSQSFDYNCLGERNIHVDFTDVDEKYRAEVEFYDENLDVAVLRLATEITMRRPLNRVIKCHPGHSFYTISYLRSSRKTRRSIIASTDYTTKFSSAHLVLFESDDFEHGCSGSPGITTNIDGETGLVTMLLGCLTTSKDSFYYGVKMTEVKKRISKKRPCLAQELFGSFDKIKVKNSACKDKITRQKLDANDSSKLKQRSTRINGS